MYGRCPFKLFLKCIFLSFRCVCVFNASLLICVYEYMEIIKMEILNHQDGGNGALQSPPKRLETRGEP